MRVSSLFCALLCCSLGCKAPAEGSAPQSAPSKAAPSKAEPSKAAPSEAAPSEVAPADVEPPAEPVEGKAPIAIPPRGEPVGLCESLCVQRNQMRAVGPEVIEADCRRECEGIETRAPSPDCAAAAKDARARVEAKPMKARARRFWGLLSEPGLSCGVVDPVLVGLSEAWREEEPDRRRTAVLDQVQADPWLTLTCPAGKEALGEAGVLDSVDAVVERCPLAELTPGQPIHRDLDAATVLAVEVVRTHWRALGATSSDHDILLSTVLLSTALGNAR